MSLPRFLPACLVFSLIAVCACDGGYSGKKQPVAENGVLDLREWDFEKDGPVELNGQWEFYWKRFLKAEDFRDGKRPAMTGYFNIPGVWNGYRVAGRELGGDGYATYRLRILIGSAERAAFAFLCPSAVTAYKLYVNGRQARAVGRIGRNRRQSRPRALPGRVFVEQSTSITEIILQVSNFHQSFGGTNASIRMGHNAQMDIIADRELGLSLFIAGAFFIMGWYHIGIFYNRMIETAPLYLGLFCLIMTVQSLIVGPSFLFKLFPRVPWAFYIKLELVLSFLALPTFASLVDRIFRGLLQRTVRLILWGVGIVSTILIGVLAVRDADLIVVFYQYWTLAAIAYGFVILIIAWVRRKDGALIFLIGFFFLGLTVAFDLLNEIKGYFDTNFVQYGLFAFILTQAYLLSTRSSRAFATAEKLTGEMEDRVENRTRELEIAREDADARRKQMEALSAVSRRVAAAPDLVEVLTAVHYELMGQLGPLGVWLCLVDRRHGELYSESYRPVPGYARTDGQHRLLKKFRIPLISRSGSTLLRSYEKKRPVFFPRLASRIDGSVDRTLLHLSGAVSIVHLPLIVRGNVIGILAIVAMKKGILRRRDLPWMALFAEQITDAVHSATLLARAEAAKAEIFELNEFSRELNATTDLTTYLNSVGDFVRKKYHADGMIVLRTDLQSASLVYLYDNVPEHLKPSVREINIPLREEGGILYKIFRRKKPFFASRSMLEKDVFRRPYPGMERDREIIERVGRAYLLVPLIAQQRVIGMALFSALGEGHELNRQDVPAIVRFCSQIAGGVYASSLMKHIREKHSAAEEARREAEIARERAERQRTRVEDLNAFTRALSQSTELTRILELTFGHFYDNYGAKQGALTIVDREQGDAYVYNPSETPTLTERERRVFENFRFRLDDPRDFISAAYRHNRTVYLRKLGVARGSIPWQDDLVRRLEWGNDAALIVPLAVRGEVTAILVLRIHEDRPRLGRDDRADIKAIADQIAGAIHGSSLLKQLEEGSRELARANDKLQRMDKAKSRFFANISHEFRTPLTMLIAPLESLLGGDFGEEVRANNPIFKSMLQNGLRLLRLINNLLDYTKIEAGRMSANKARTNMSELMAFYRANVQSGAEARGLSLNLRDNCPGVQADVDRELMEKAMMNLLSNAIKFTPAGGEVVIQMDAADQEYFTIAVTDTGVGIPEDQLEVIFERFAQSEDTSLREQEGTGIGLSLTREIVELHGGAVQAQSRVGEGSVFTMTLPIAAGEAPEESLEIQHREEVKEYLMADIRASYMRMLEEPDAIAGAGEYEAMVAENGKHEILLVEDNPDMRGFLVMLLENEYKVHAAANGADGLSMARDLGPDLIVSDVMMPVMDGNSMTRELKKNPGTRDIPVLLLSAKADVLHRIESLEFGADDYLAKPFNSTELLTRIRNHIKGKRMEKELKREKKERDKEFQQASLIQKSILTPPEVIHGIAGLEVDFRYLPMNHEISGDYYHVSPLKNGIASVFVADATGHGTQAALTTMQMDLLYRENLDRKYPDERFEYINGKFTSELRSKNFFTGIIADIYRDKLRYSSAGHPGQYLIQGNEPRELRTRGGWVGMMEGQAYVMEEVAIDSGDVLLLFTDGIFEVFNERREEFGDERLLELVQEGIRADLFKRPVAEITDFILTRVDEHRGGHPFDDDITLFAIRVK